MAEPAGFLARRGAGIAVMVALVATVVVTAAFHELAHDESQAWNIARTARWPWDVLALNRYEGHTPVWTVALWPLTLLGDPRWMQALSAALALCAAGMLVRDAPFGRLGSALAVFGYFIVYDYAIIARPYALTLLCTALWASRMRAGETRPAVLFGLCAAIGAGSAYGLVLSVPFAAVSLLHVLDAPQRRSLPGRPPPSCSPALLGALGVYVATGIATALFVLLPNNPISEFEQAMRTGERLGRDSLLLTAVTAAFPHLNQLPAGLGRWLTTPGPGGIVAGASAVAVALAVALRLAARPPFLVAWVGAVVSISAAANFAGALEERYLGHLYLAALGLCWAASRERGSVSGGAVPDGPGGLVRARGRAAADAVLLAVLGYHAIVGLGSAAFDVATPRTPWKEAARLLEARPDADSLALLNDYGFPVIPLLAYLDRPAWHNDCGGCTSRHSRWRLRTDRTAERLRREWCSRADLGEPTVAITPREAFARVPGVRTVAVYPPGRRDTKRRPAFLLELESPAALCSPNGERWLRSPAVSSGSTAGSIVPGAL